MRLLVVEDERHLLDILKKRLVREHYSVDACMNGNDAWEYVQMTNYDGIILDIMLPGMDGITLLRNIRGKGNKTPILLLTARDSIEDRVNGLDAGADDYLVKPFAFEELLARIRVMLRRTSNTQEEEKLAYADVEINLKSHEVRRGGTLIELSSKEYALLNYFMHNQGNVLSREQIEHHVWNYDYMGGSNMVDVYVRYLRKKLDDPFEEKLIHTVRGAGYVLKIKK